MNQKYEDGSDKISFPKCTTNCDVIKELGAGECESICPEKFLDESKINLDTI
jgi:hypothetical protein